MDRARLAQIADGAAERDHRITVEKLRLERMADSLRTQTIRTALSTAAAISRRRAVGNPRTSPTHPTPEEQRANLTVAAAVEMRVGGTL